MKELRADLHIHSCLSPCAEPEMLPTAIVKQAKALGLDMIAICDHNSAENVAAVDYLQYPRDTLARKSGDCDDLSILYCSLLQALDIDTAFVTTPGHIFAAVALGVAPEDAKRLFAYLGMQPAQIESMFVMPFSAWCFCVSPTSWQA